MIHKSGSILDAPHFIPMASGHNRLSEIAEHNSLLPGKVSATVSPRECYPELPHQYENPLPFSTKFDEIIKL